MACVPSVQVSKSSGLNGFPKVPRHIDGAIRKGYRKKRRKRLTLMGDLLKHKQLQTTPISASENGSVNGSLDCPPYPAILPQLPTEHSPSLTVLSALNGQSDNAVETVQDNVSCTGYTNGHGELAATPVTEPAKKKKRRSTVSSVCHFLYIHTHTCTNIHTHFITQFVST